MRTHGLRATYVAGCRCDACTTANRAYRKKLELHGTDLVDSEPVRQYVKLLRAAGVGRRTIARQAGVAQTVIDRLVGINRSRPEFRMRAETVAKILAVTADTSSYMPALGAVRRLQALVAIGWTQTALAHEIGWTLANLNNLTRKPGGIIRRATHDRIVAIYERLEDTPGSSTRAKNIARNKGWLPPAAWDDIDHDPTPTDVLPTPPRRRMNYAYGDHNPDTCDFCTEATWLYRNGEHPETIAARLGMTHDAFTRAVNRHGLKSLPGAVPLQTDRRTA